MEDKNLQGELMLLQYIKDILEEPQKAKLDMFALPREQHSLGRACKT